MDSLLSHAEIDALLRYAVAEDADKREGAVVERAHAVPGGTTRDVIPFDFTRPCGISRGFEKNLLNVCEALAKAGTAHFTNQFRVNCALEFLGLQLQTFGEYAAKLPTPTCVAVVSFAPLEGRALLHLDLSLSYAMLKKLLGGAAEPEAHYREYTEIELSIVRSILLRFVDLFKEACARLVALEPRILAVENNPAYANALAPGEGAVLLEYSFHLEAVEGRVGFCIPAASLEPVRGLFDPEQAGAAHQGPAAGPDRELVRSLLENIEVEAVAKLAETTVNAAEILRLAEGRLLVLNKPVDAPLVLEIEGLPLFTAIAGQVRQRRALRITGRNSEE